MFWRHNKPAFIWALIILILCGIPGDKIPEMTFLEWLKPDKVVHLILFGVQCFLLLKGFNKQNSFIYLQNNAVALALIFTISYGALVEVLQEFIFIHRSGDIRDATANAFGALIGLWIFKKDSRKKAGADVKRL